MFEEGLEYNLVNLLTDRYSVILNFALGVWMG